MTIDQKEWSAILVCAWRAGMLVGDVVRLMLGYMPKSRLGHVEIEAFARDLESSGVWPNLSDGRGGYVRTGTHIRVLIARQSAAASDAFFDGDFARGEALLPRKVRRPWAHSHDREIKSVQAANKRYIKTHRAIQWRESDKSHDWGTVK